MSSTSEWCVRACAGVLALGAAAAGAADMAAGGGPAQDAPVSRGEDAAGVSLPPSKLSLTPELSEVPRKLAPSQDEMPMSLEQAVVHAASEASAVRAADATVDAKREAVKAAQRGNWPTLNFELDTMRAHGQPVSFFSQQGISTPEAPLSTLDATGYFNEGQLKLSAPLFQNGKLFFQNSPSTNEAIGNYSKAQADDKSQAADAAQSAAKAYLDALSWRDVVGMEDDACNRLRRRLEYIAERVREKVEFRADELAAAALLKQQEAGLHSAQDNYEAQQVQLVTSMGMPPDQRIALQLLPAELPALPPADLLVKNSLRGQPVLESQQAALQAAHARVAEAEGADSPTVTIEGDAINGESFHGYNSANYSSIGLKVTVPVFYAQNRALASSRRFEVTEQEKTLAAARDSIIQSIYKRYYAYVQAVDTIHVNEAKVAQLRFQLDVSSARYEKRLEGLDDLLNDDSNVLNAQILLVQSRYAAWESYADLIDALGRPFSLKPLMP